MTARHGGWAVAACAAMVMGLTGCGGEGGKAGDDGGSDGGKGGATESPTSLDIERLPGPEIAKRAKAEQRAATSFRLVTGTQKPEASGKWDVTMDTAGNCVGSWRQDSRGSYEAIKHGKKAWIKPDRQFWNYSARPESGWPDLFTGKWLRGTPSSKILESVFTACDMRRLVHDATSVLNDDVTKGPTVIVEGQKAITLKAEDPKTGNPVTLYVATEGKPYPLKLEQGDETAPTTAIFTDYEKPVPNTTPPEGETVNVALLETPGRRAD
ncbi:hypothetical protein ACQUSR_19650 [Streptomyces sp. P1-3]|uniref:hypothetical protein n=1 Tax=Streptomyces sp. P1-3 TaxID=3421658 RepID=UPI003D36CC87